MRVIIYTSLFYIMAWFCGVLIYVTTGLTPEDTWFWPPTLSLALLLFAREIIVIRKGGYDV